MSHRGNCWDDAEAESSFSSLTKERVKNRISIWRPFTRIRLLHSLAGLIATVFFTTSFGAEPDKKTKSNLIDSYKLSLSLGSYIGISHFCKEGSNDYTRDAILMEQNIMDEARAMSEGMSKSIELAVLTGIAQGRNGFLYSPIEEAFIDLAASRDLKAACNLALSEFLKIRSLK